jgi:hypothetical protein
MIKSGGVFMLVSFVKRDFPEILLNKEYSNVLPLIEMVKQKAMINIMFDTEGEKVVRGRLYDYEYMLNYKDGEFVDTLQIEIEQIN